MISKWNHLPLTPEQDLISATLEEKYPQCPTICKLLAQRGVASAAETEKFFRPLMSDLHDPFLMRDMHKAVNRLNAAIGAKEKIMIYGDYDVDGTTAVALVYRFLLNYYSGLDYYIPDRYEEGYGISTKSIDYAAEHGITLIITLDCGIKAVERIAYARSKGIDFIICDHHVPDAQLPDATAILNPKLEDEPYPYKHLSGCGVGYKFMQGFAISNGLNIANDLEPLLDLVAVSIVSDIVPITGENRILTHHGLRRLNSNPSVGLRAIIRVCQLHNKKNLNISDIIFKIGPRINASGRMQSGKEAVDLLVSRDYNEAYHKSREIDQYNEDRKELDKRITEEANVILQNHVDVANRRSIVVYNKDWHKGIIGIVASRFTELYYRPAVVLTLSDGLATGSARSVQGFDIYKAVESCRDLLENFGGHTYAVGLSLKEEHIRQFTERFEKYVSENIEPAQMMPQIDIDTELNFSEITNDFVTLLRQFNPFGPGNNKPTFYTPAVCDYGTSRLVGRQQEHLKLELVDSKSGRILNAIAFNKKEYYEYIKSGKPFDICYTIEDNQRGGDDIQLLIRDIRCCE
ncbi:MAG: single-stranded-DNA-specific exonuclease RecJ [Bacteroidaceae bacterium]|nr:single-stranded-DNA-specific exonuclease RecJ [Bacteroidales bacterium]MBQ2980318.1 single-stranded-DNA-specific exonuclease RecJ [Bacteroidaceae bacterium]